MTRSDLPHNNSVKSNPAEPGNDWHLWITILASLVLGYNVITHLGQGIGDEDVHSFQIRWFIGGHFEIFKYITMLPAYHAAVAALGTVLGGSLNALRGAHLLLAACAIPAFYSLCRRTWPEETASRTLQFVFLPLLFPLFFLIYTDIPALIFTLLMVERTLARRYLVAGLLGLVAVAVRQPNLVWVAYACVLALLQENGFAITFDNIKRMARRLWPFAVVFLMFGAFVVVNGGVAVGDTAQHQISFNLSNLYFFLFVSFFLFLPLNIEYGKRIARFLMAHKWVLLALAGAFALYMVTYDHPHKYNATRLSFYRHNLLLHYTCDVMPIRIAAFIPMAWMSLTFWLTTRNSRHGQKLLWLFPFAALSFVPMPLIEQRYYFPAIVLFIAFAPTQSRWGIPTTLTLYIGVIGYFLFNISRANFFL